MGVGIGMLSTFSSERVQLKGVIALERSFFGALRALGPSLFVGFFFLFGSVRFGFWFF